MAQALRTNEKHINDFLKATMVVSDCDISDVMAANEQVDKYEKMLEQKQAELKKICSCLERNVSFPTINGEAPLYCSQDCIKEEIAFYEKLKDQAIQQRNLLWEKHLGVAFEETN